MGEAARLFVALELPPAVRDALVAWRVRTVRDGDGALRGVPAASLHVTLCFLGAQPLAAVPEIADAVRATATGVAVDGLVLGGAVWLPRRRPRVLAVALEDAGAELGALQGALAEALAAGGWYAPERRRFLPHVTVARVRSGARPPATLLRAPVPAPPALAVPAATVTLMRSHLGGGPARYEPLARVPLA